MSAKLAGAPYRIGFSANFFNHTWAQPSVIARIHGTDEEAVIIGAHLDSINQFDPSNGRSPGADDDASGTTTILEALRSLAKSGFRPKRTIEFHFYSAEEVGLLGSRTVAKAYAKENRQVAGMLQLDMIGYMNDNKTKIYVDYTDNQLSELVRRCVDRYSKLSWINGECGYACSDHASFIKVGYRSAYVSEDIPNHHMHRPSDSLILLDFKAMKEFTKFVIGFAIELAEPCVNL
ncbi:hypothetical protein L0F63_005762 [Massospora cicadina]|nr:hypothetical protein L0F63_005762 [Massospora cicadina]